MAPCARHRPDAVLMDLRMAELDGVEATRRIRAGQPDTEIVVLTTHADEASILAALRAGARGYLTKDAGTAEIARHPRGREPPDGARPHGPQLPARRRDSRGAAGACPEQPAGRALAARPRCSR